MAKKTLIITIIIGAIIALGVTGFYISQQQGGEEIEIEEISTTQPSPEPKKGVVGGIEKIIEQNTRREIEKAIDEAIDKALQSVEQFPGGEEGLQQALDELRRQGADFGQIHSASQCVLASIKLLGSCQEYDIACQLQANAFQEGCLGTTKLVSELCQGAPPPSNAIELANWAAEFCDQLGYTSDIYQADVNCTRLVTSAVNEACQ